MGRRSKAFVENSKALSVVTSLSRPMRAVYIFLLSMLAGYGVQAQYYSQNIFIHFTPDASANDAIRDLQYYLGKATGKNFTAETSAQAGPGIHLVIGDLPRLQGKGTEACSIEGNSSGMTITATHVKGLTHGIYTYLFRLGFRWYLPGSEWEYIPTLKNITVNISAIEEPSFSVRGFFGTGGMQQIKSLDPDGKLVQKWADWKRRNRMGGAIDPGGHYWETFDLKYRSTLELHPEYLAMSDGKRSPWSAGVKLCISNKDLVDLFVKDRVDYLRELLRDNQYGPGEQILIPVDPSDGGGHCTCGPCMRMGSVSDRVFYLANKTASAVASVSNKAYVNLYAYNEHAAPPREHLEDNVIVQIIPYAFQKTGTPEEMIARWKIKSNNLLVYDYYGVTDWHLDQPLTDKWNPASFAARLKYLSGKGIRGASIESSYSAAATGRGLYYFARLGWNINESAESINTEFLGQMFGTASVGMKQFYQQLDAGFSIKSGIPGLLNLLAQASSESSDPMVRKRIRLLKAYVHYLALFSEYSAAGTDDNWARLLRYVWQVYPTGMIHSSRIAQLYSQKQVPAAYAGFTFNNMLSAGTDIPVLTEQAIEADFNADVRSFAGVQSMAKATGKSYQFKNTAASNLPAEMMILNMPEFEISPDANGQFRFSAKLNESTNDATVQISVKDKDGAIVYSADEPLSVTWKEINIGKLKPGIYYTLIISNKSWTWLRVNSNFYFAARSIPTYALLGAVYEYVPAGTHEIYFSSGDKSTPDFKDGSGKKLTPVIAKDNIFKVLIPGNDKGCWIRIENTQYKFLEFITKPSQLFLHNNYSVLPR